MVANCVVNYNFQGSLQLLKTPVAIATSRGSQQTSSQAAGLPVFSDRTFESEVMNGSSHIRMERNTSEAPSQYNYPDYYSKEIDLNLSLDSLQDSDSDSLTHEIQYQSQLKDWILDEDHVIDQPSEVPIAKDTYGDPTNPTVEDDFTFDGTLDISNTAMGENASELNKMSLRNVNTSYSNLRYDPDWKKKTSPGHITASFQEDIPDDSTSLSGYCSSGGTSPAAPQEQVKVKTSEGQVKDEVSENYGAISFPHIGKHPNGGHTEPNRDRGNKNGLLQQKNSQKDFIEKNKVTLGVRGSKRHSYLNIHRKKSEEDSTDQLGEMPFCILGTIDMRMDLKKDLRSVTSTSGPALPKEELKKRASENFGVEECHCANYQWASEDQMPASDYNTCQQFMQNGQSHINLRQFAIGDEHFLEPSFLSQATGNTEISTMVQVPSIHQGLGSREENVLFNSDFNPLQPRKSDTSLMDADSEENSHTSACSSSSGQQQMKRTQPMNKAEIQRLASLLKQEVKLGGIGPTYRLSKEREEQLKQQKAYAKLVHERNRNQNQVFSKVDDVEIQPTDNKKCARRKALEYAKNVPKPQTLPKIALPDQTQRQDIPGYPPTSEKISPQLKRLQDLQLRHEREKMAVAAFNALHIL
ncbi:jhy protein homolog [Pelodytes ibericus]